ncbi:hypothetical protein [Brachybacterium sp.]|uniref:hypothetical protein n=1 Tax=Brachybacterium sp. TaxID=1891286 RepID=UPI002ED15285
MSTIADAAPPLAGIPDAASGAFPGSPSATPFIGRRRADSAPELAWERTIRRTSRRGRRRARAVPAIATAQFQIQGPPHSPRLDAEVTMHAGTDFASAVDSIMERVVPDMEDALGHRFTENVITFSIAPSLPILTRQRSATTVLTIS